MVTTTRKAKAPGLSCIAAASVLAPPALARQPREATPEPRRPLARANLSRENGELVASVGVGLPRAQAPKLPLARGPRRAGRCSPVLVRRAARRRVPPPRDRADEQREKHRADDRQPQRHPQQALQHEEEEDEADERDGGDGD